ncbi:energy transducer TonB [Pontibacter locisalis]|uniref:Energy transducer TonB n=1 Tax=Pontibacter locisalis TaxID=1719035 RepID=A0ABW5IGG3_9BACT
MKKSYYLSATFNEVIFKNRNKIYGAYYLRRIYEKHIVIAIFVATAIFTTMLAAPLVQNAFKTPPGKKVTALEKPDSTTVFVIPPTPPIEMEKPKTEEVAVKQKEQKVKTEIYAETKVVRDDAKVETKELADVKDLTKVNFGTERIEGIPPSIPDVKVADTPPTGIGGNGEESNPKVFIYAEQMPEFEGGEKAMLKYISKKIVYPSAAQRIGIEGLVVVSFIVSETGEIKEAKVLKGLGHGTDEEALRVVKGMPSWKPGKQNGRAVAVRYTLPIRFSIK